MRENFRDHPVAGAQEMLLHDVISDELGIHARVTTRRCRKYEALVVYDVLKRRVRHEIKTVVIAETKCVFRGEN